MKIPVGIEIETNNVILIEELPLTRRGLKCGCVCPECGSKLVARLGDKTVHHFAHYRGTETSKCQMTALHLLGQHVLSRLPEISIREYRVSCNNQYDTLNREYEANEIKLFGSTSVRIKSAVLEKTIGSIRSDVFTNSVYENTELEINFEIKVWHEVDDVKAEKVKALKLNTIEIDLIGLIHEPNVIYEMVVEELNDSINQTIVYLNDQFISACRLQAENELVDRIEKENVAIESWRKSINKQISSNGFKLPDYSYRLNEIPNKYLQHKINNLLPRRPKIDQVIDVISFNQNPDGYFELVVNFSSKSHQIPILLNSTDASILSNPDTSYLRLDEKYLGNMLDEIEFKWGRNKVASSFQHRCNEIISKQLRIKSQNDLAKISNCLTMISALESNGQYVRSQNYLSIRKRANKYYNELIKKGCTAKGLKGLIYEEVDPFQIFGCEAKYWQLVVLRDICWVRHPYVEVSFLSKRLEEFGIKIVPPFSDLLYKSKIMKENNIKMPFTTPFKLLSNYLRHLTACRFLKVQRGGNLMKLLPFGEEYKKL